MKTTQKSIIEELEARIAADCKPIDRDEAFNEMLDECYSFKSVGGPFASMSPSRVLPECDPVAHRCGVNDYADGMERVEVGNETYQQDDVERVKSELSDELDSSLTDAESELEQLVEDEADKGEINSQESKIADIKRNIEDLQSHSF